MSWPLSQDYNEAIQSPAANFTDPALKKGAVVANAMGLPIPFSGNFADVYQVRCPDGSRWAVKRFTREVPGLRERYQEISAWLRKAKLPFTVDFSYLEQGIRVGGKWYPVLKMQWVEGLTLNQFVGQYLDKPAMLEALLQLWAKMGKYLRAAHVGHCDLQHGNILLVPGSTPNALALKLIDYDGMWIPPLAKSPSGEVGHANYQHPRRLREGTYSLEVDRFPLLLVATAMRALKADKSLWAKYDNGDNLLFKESDLAAPGQSALFEELASLPDAGLVMLAAQVRAALKGPLESAALLEEAMPDVRPTPSVMPTRPSRLAPASAAVTTQKTVPTATATADAPAGGALDFEPAVRKAGGSFVKKGKGTAKAAPVGVPLPVWIGGAVALVVVATAVGGVTLWGMRGKTPTSEPRIVHIVPSLKQESKPPPIQANPVGDPPKEVGSGDPEAKIPPKAAPTEELLEGESLIVLNKSSDFGTGPQKMLEWPDYQWSNNAQLLCSPMKAGEFVDLQLPVPADGRYGLVVYLTKAPDFGVVQFSLDGKPLGKPIDCFEPGTVVRTGPISLGAADLKQGNAVLRLEVTGTNENSARGRYSFGLDCVLLKPVGQPPPSSPSSAGLPFDVGWDEPVDPDHDCKFLVGKNTLTIELPAGLHDLSVDNKRMNAPGLLRDVEGDFTVQLRVDGGFDPIAAEAAANLGKYTSAGLVVIADEQTYVRMKRVGFTGVNVNYYPSFEAFSDGKRRGTVFDPNGAVPSNGTERMELRLERKGGNLKASYSVGGEDWTEVRTADLNLPTKLKVGVVAVSTSLDPFKPRFDDFRLTTAKKTVVAVNPPTPEKDLRKPPTGDDLVKAREAVQQEFKADYAKLNTPKERTELADKLRAAAFASKDKPDRQYALLVEARDLAARGEDLAASQRIIAETAAAFVIDPKEAKEAALLAAGATFSTKAAAKSYLAEVGPLLQEAKADDDYERVALFLPAVRKATTEAHDADMVKTVASLEKLQKEYEAVKKDLQTLKEKPDDAEANLAVGKFYCFQKQDYDKGDPYLVKSGNLALATAAAKDVDDPKDVAEQVALADSWMKLADNTSPAVRLGVQRRAYDWYSKALPNLSDKEEKRVKTRVVALTKQFPDILASWENLDVSKVQVIGNSYLRVAPGQMISTKLPIGGAIEIVLVARTAKAPPSFEFLQGKEIVVEWEVQDKNIICRRPRDPAKGRSSLIYWQNDKFTYTPNVWVTYSCKIAADETDTYFNSRQLVFDKFQSDLSKPKTIQLLVRDQPLEVKSFTVSPLD